METTFFKPNKMFPKKYYLIFIFDCETYYENTNYISKLEKFNFHYCFYDKTKDIIDYKSLKEFKFNEIKFNTKELNEEKKYSRFFIIKSDMFKKVKENEAKFEPSYYYVENGIDLLSFLEEIWSEYDFLINKLSEKQYYYSFFKLKSFSDCYYFFPNKIKVNKRIIIALNNKYLFFG